MPRKSTSKKQDTTISKEGIAIQHSWVDKSPHIIDLQKKQSTKQSRVRDSQLISQSESSAHFTSDEKVPLFNSVTKDLTHNTVQKEDKGGTDFEDVFAPPPYYSLPGFRIPKNWYKRVGVFLMLIALCVVPFQALSFYAQLDQKKDSVFSLSNQALEELLNAGKAAKSIDLQSAQSNFAGAFDTFSLAQEQVDSIGSVTTDILSVIPQLKSKVEAGESLLAAGKEFAQAGEILTRAGNRFLAGPSSNYFFALEEFRYEIGAALSHSLKAQQLVASIESSALPEEHRAVFAGVQSASDTIVQGLREVALFNDALLNLLGQKKSRTYLVMFTNSNELRGVGGFMGSFALLEVDQGKIKGITIPGGGTYDLEGALTAFVEPPYPLQLLQPLWQFRDANWWPDFPLSAQKIQWFYENSGGEKTDGVIIMTADLMADLIDVVGPIELEQYNRVFTGENFVIEAQKISQEEYIVYNDGENTPKQFIADLAPVVLQRAFSLTGENMKQLISVLHAGLNQRQLVLYSENPTTQSVFESLEWSGHLRETTGDFLSVVHTNLAGGKTDQVISQVIDHHATISSDGAVTNTVTLRRTHHGEPDLNRYTGVQNNSYVRLYVPEGSELLSAIGFEKPDDKFFEQPDPRATIDVDLQAVEYNKKVDQQSGIDIYTEHSSKRTSTVFGGWLQLRPGTTQEVTVSYTLPQKLNFDQSGVSLYSIVIQKQTGDKNTSVQSRVDFDDSFTALKTFPAQQLSHNHSAIFASDLLTDIAFGVALTKN